MSDAEDIFNSFYAAGPRQALTYMNDNPDEGARAIALGQATGVNPQSIYSDLDGFETQHRAVLTKGIVQGNSKIDDYIRTHPMGAVVSNDDYGNLDTFSRGAGSWNTIRTALHYPQAMIGVTVDAATKGFLRRANQGGQDPYIQRATNPNTNMFGDIGAAASTLVYEPLDLLARTFAGVAGAAGDIGKELVSDQFGRTAENVVDWAFQRGDFLSGHGPAAELITAAKPWIDAGVEPPKGIHPEIDRAKAEINQAGVEKLAEDHANAQASATRERAPELFHGFAKQHFGDDYISIPADAAIGLYGDKLPIHDDGLLGWVPGIGSQLDAARTAGSDVHIPIADWVTYADPKVAQALQDDIKIWPGGVTAREAAEPIEPKIVVDSPLAQVRDASGTEPVFGQGDRKLTLSRTEGLPEYPDHDEFKILDATGKDVGDVTIIPHPDTGQLEIGMISGNAGMWTNSFGPSLIQDLRRQLIKEYPDYVDSNGNMTITGRRVTGASDHAGNEARPVTVKFKASSPTEGIRETREMLSAASGDSVLKGEIEGPLKDQFDNIRANAAGLDLPSYRRIQKLIEDRFDEDLEAATRRAEKVQARRQTKEWKDNETAVRAEVEQSIRDRPEVAADLLVGSGEINGKKVRQRIPLRADDLSDAQKAALPDHYYSSNGVPVDEVAQMLGFQSGDSMVEALAKYNEAKAGRSANEMLESLIKDETAAQMEARFGDLQQNILDEAQDQALSETNLNLLAEETYAIGLKAGQTIDKAALKTEARRLIGDMTMAHVNSWNALGLAGRYGRDAERAMIAEDWAGAFAAMQRKTLNTFMAAEMKKIEKDQATFDRTANQFRKREVSSVDPEYTNFIHQILTQIGKPVRRSVQDIIEQINAGGEEVNSLQKFVEHKSGQLRELPVWEQLYDASWRKNFPELTVDEFNAVNDSIKALVHNGRDELKIIRAGDAANLAEIKDRMIKGLEDNFDVLKRSHKPGPAAEVIRNYYSGSLQTENVLNRWDGYDPHGPWNQYIMRDLIESANQEEAWRKEYAEKLESLEDDTNVRRSVDNPIFRDQDTRALIPFTRENLRAVMLNTGNAGNLVKLAHGYGLDSDTVMAWVHQHATKADWDFVQGVWDKVFKDIKSKSDIMYRNLTGGVAAENIPIRPIETPFGTYDGGYYPVIFHSEMEGKSQKLMGKDRLEQGNYVRATTPAGYTKGRTGYVAPLALDLDAMPGRIAQQLHDIAMRPAVINASKIVFDKDVRSAIRARYGAEYRDGLTDYLVAVANSANMITSTQRGLKSFGEFARQNLITTLVGLNPGTVLKHGPTAFVTSMREVGAANYLKATKSLFSISEETGESQWGFAIRNSLELQRRDRNWQETLYGATNELSYGSKLKPWRQKIIELSSKPVALSDMISAVPTWLAKYNESIASGATHGDAVYLADRSVRRAHGSTAITSRTALQRDLSPWVTSVYNFFSDVMNRQMETVWKAGDTWGLVKEGEYKEAMKQVPALSASLFAYAIWPAIVEELVSPLQSKHDEPWAEKAAKGLAYTLGSSWVGVRDITSYLIGGFDPQIGMGGTALREATNIFKDFSRDKPLSKAHAGKVIQDGAAMAGAFTGMMPAQVGRTGRFLFDYSQGQVHPKGPWGWLVGARYGTLNRHSTTFQNYMEGKAR